jgi:hypothetical protein
MRAAVTQGGLVSPVLCSLYVNEMLSQFRHVKLALNADDTALATTSPKPSLLISFHESYVGSLVPWLRDWKTAVNV